MVALYNNIINSEMKVLILPQSSYKFVTVIYLFETYNTHKGKEKKMM